MLIASTLDHDKSDKYEISIERERERVGIQDNNRKSHLGRLAPWYKHARIFGYCFISMLDLFGNWPDLPITNQPSVNHHDLNVKIIYNEKKLISQLL